MKLTVSIVALGVLMAAPAAAQYAPAERITLGGTFGANVPLTPDELTDNFNTRTSLGGFFSGPLYGKLGWRADLGLDTNGCQEEVCDELGVDLRMQWSRFTGGLQYTTGDRTAGYGYFTLGPYVQKLKGNAPGDFLTRIPFARSDTKFGICFGGGVQYHVGEMWGIGADLAINAVFQGEGDADTVWYLLPRGQVFWRF